jgi:hypothetical protein
MVEASMASASMVRMTCSEGKRQFGGGADRLRQLGGRPTVEVFHLVEWKLASLLVYRTTTDSSEFGERLVGAKAVLPWTYSAASRRLRNRSVIVVSLNGSV